MEKQKFNFTLTFVDLLFNVLLGFVFLFVVAFIMIHPPQSKKMDPKAEILVTMEWPDESDHDVDLWILPPDGEPVGYKNKQNGVIFLNRDDLGLKNDIIQTPSGETILKSNEEMITLKGKPPGEYVVNIKLYRKESGSLPIKCIVKLFEINPTYRNVTTNNVILFEQSQESTAFRFTIDEDESIINIDAIQQPFISNYERHVDLNEY